MKRFQALLGDLRKRGVGRPELASTLTTPRTINPHFDPYFPQARALFSRTASFLALAVVAFLLAGSVTILPLVRCGAQGCSYYHRHCECDNPLIRPYNCDSDYPDCHDCLTCYVGGAPCTSCSCVGPTSDSVTINSVTVTYTGSPLAGNYGRGGATVHITATDSGGHTINIAGDISGSISSGGTLDYGYGTEGHHAFSFSALCSSSPGTPASGSAEVWLDLTPPSITSAVLSASGWTSAASVTYACAASDALSGLFDVTSPSRNAEGWYGSLTCTARDNAGNSASSTSGSFGIDRTPPDVPISVPTPTGNTPWYLGSVTATCNPSDALSGLASASPAPVSTLQGANTLTCSAIDNAGNGNSSSVTVQVDSIAPSASLTCNGGACGSSWYTAPVSLAAPATDATSGVGVTTILIDGSAGTTVMDGVHAITWQVCDVAGNCTSVSSTTVRVDSVAPSGSWQCNGTGCGSGWQGAPADMSINASDATSGVASTTIFIDGSAGTTVGEGVHTVSGQVCDVAGNCAAMPPITVSVDITPPTVALEASIIVIGSSNLVIAADALSGLDNITVTITGNGMVPRVYVFPSPAGSVTVSWDGLDGNGQIVAFGAYTVTAMARDLAGNTATTSGSWLRPAPRTPTNTILYYTKTPIPSDTPEPIVITTTKGAVIVVTATPAPSATPSPVPAPAFVLPVSLPPIANLPFVMVLFPLLLVVGGTAFSRLSIFNDSRWAQARKVQQDVARHQKLTGTIDGGEND